MNKISFVMILAGCIMMTGGLVYAQEHGGDHQMMQMPMDGQKQAADTGVSQGSVNVGNKICPVTGEKVGQGMDAVTYEYKGKIYNFCCAACIDEFKKDPDKYIKKVEEELQSAAK